jgi:hypothetical protein
VALAFLLLLFLAGVVNLLIPVEVHSESCGNAVSVVRGAAIIGGFDATESDECHTKAAQAIGLSAVTAGLALVGVGGSVVAARSSR